MPQHGRATYITPTPLGGPICRQNGLPMSGPLYPGRRGAVDNALLGSLGFGLLVYDRLRVLLRDELGTAPGTPLRSIHRRLLGSATTTTS